MAQGPHLESISLLSRIKQGIASRGLDNCYAAGPVRPSTAESILLILVNIMINEEH
jgi:hypothetical protein